MSKCNGFLLLEVIQIPKIAPLFLNYRIKYVNLQHQKIQQIIICAHAALTNNANQTLHCPVVISWFSARPVHVVEYLNS